MVSEMKLKDGKMHPVTRHAYEMHRVLASALGQLFTRAEAQWQSDLVGSLASCGWVHVDEQLPPQNLPVYAIDRNNNIDAIGKSSVVAMKIYPLILVYDHNTKLWYDREHGCGYTVTDWHMLPPF